MRSQPLGAAEMSTEVGMADVSLLGFGFWVYGFGPQEGFVFTVFVEGYGYVGAPRLPELTERTKPTPNAPQRPESLVVSPYRTLTGLGFRVAESLQEPHKI